MAKWWPAEVEEIRKCWDNGFNISDKHGRTRGLISYVKTANNFPLYTRQTMLG